MDTPMWDMTGDEHPPAAVKPRRGRIEIGIAVVLVAAAIAVGYELLVYRHTKQLELQRTAWLARVNRMEARAMAAENILGDRNARVANLSSDVTRMTKEMETLRETQNKTELKLAAALAAQADTQDLAANLRNTIAADSDEIDQLQQNLLDEQAAADGLAADLQTQRAAAAQLNEDLAAKQAQLAALVTATDAERAKAGRDLAEANDLNTTLRRQLDAVLADYAQAVAAADKAKAAMQGEIELARADAASLRQQLDDANDALIAAESFAAENIERLFAAFPELARSYVRVSPPTDPQVAGAAPHALPAVHRTAAPFVVGPSCAAVAQHCDDPSMFQTVKDDASVASSE